MAETDWDVVVNSLAESNIVRGVTSAISRPSGGGSFIHGFNSITSVDGAVALFADKAEYKPTAFGASIRGCLRRGAGDGTTAFSPFLFVGLQGTPPDIVTDKAYILGLSNGPDYHITLMKAVLNSGVLDASPNPAVNGVLARSTLAYPHDSSDRSGGPATAGAWHHLRLDMIVNTGDVILKVFQNNLSTNPLGAVYDWQSITGISSEGFVDDAAGIATGSPPFTGGYCGFGFASTETSRRGYFDHIELFRQIA
jgi:hypothetical protein